MACLYSMRRDYGKAAGINRYFASGGTHIPIFASPRDDRLRRHDRGGTPLDDIDCIKPEIAPYPLRPKLCRMQELQSHHQLIFLAYHTHGSTFYMKPMRRRAHCMTIAGGCCCFKQSDMNFM